LKVDLQEKQKREEIEALKARLESDQIFYGNELEKIRVRKEQALELSAVHLDQAVRRSRGLGI